jgi:hypothetical protein
VDIQLPSLTNDATEYEAWISCFAKQFNALKRKPKYVWYPVPANVASELYLMNIKLAPIQFVTYSHPYYNPRCCITHSIVSSDIDNRHTLEELENEGITPVLTRGLTTLPSFKPKSPMIDKKFSATKTLKLGFYFSFSKWDMDMTKLAKKIINETDHTIRCFATSLVSKPFGLNQLLDITDEVCNHDRAKEERFTVVYRSNQEEVKDVIADLDIVIQPSSSGFSCIFEAFQCGVPVLIIHNDKNNIRQRQASHILKRMDMQWFICSSHKDMFKHINEYASNAFMQDRTYRHLCNTDMEKVFATDNTDYVSLLKSIAT